MVQSLGPVITTALVPVSVVLTAAFVLWLPGYALTAALFSRDQLQGTERALVSVGSSIALAILTGFGLNALGISLTGWTWGFALVGLALATGALAWLQPTHRPVCHRPGGRVLPRSRDVLLFGVAALLAVAAISVARFGASEQPQEGFTQLWMFPAPGDAVRIGLSNGESNAMTYRVVLMDSTAAIAEWPSVQLEPGREWDMEVALPSDVGTGLELLLYRADVPGEIYRHVALGPFATSIVAPLPTTIPGRSPVPMPSPTLTAAPKPTSDRYTLLNPCPDRPGCWI